ncbi:hypothetical protein [Rhodohalobacter mucosus]|uniref:Uncharacterized protein n=1 Tax=Rhodohalobacter mucosus TaxID=2079485 RepID=A0A316TNE3_9BACT|nr:hypothetical protein [Rhodohalobacter mucosus]PWN06117.1 hypothetical protein DDZ15_09710 [Rhodohalobacter mucosus]
MSNVAIKTITRFRDGIYSETDSLGMTAITRGGRFVGVFISTGELSKTVADRLQHSLQHNPHHTVSVLTRKAIG